jgi:hypothetical protein
MYGMVWYGMVLYHTIPTHAKQARNNSIARSTIVPRERVALLAQLSNIGD